MDWSVADARAHFADLLEAAHEEPQFVSSRGRRVAVVLDPSTFDALREGEARKAPRWSSIGEAVDELRRICEEEGYELEIPRSEDRPAPSWDDEG